MTFPKRSRPRTPSRALEAISAKQAIAAALSFRGLSHQVRTERITTEWVDLVGTKMAGRTRPTTIQGRVLVIEVASSAWLQELTLLRPQLLRQLIARIGEPRLFDEISFRIAGR